jgi:aspartyl-tRNA(Asn)/glutamyl-tRNA(Gln) amidotransferase subunit C
VSPMPHPIPAENIFREDVQKDSLPREAALANSPKTDGLFFLVPKILEEKGA